MKSIKKYNKQRQKQRQLTEPDSEPMAMAASWRQQSDDQVAAVKKTTEINVCLDLTLISYLLVQQSKSLLPSQLFSLDHNEPHVPQSFS